MTGLRRMRLCTASTERSHGVEKKGSYRPVQKTHRKHLPGRTWRQVGHDDTGKVRGSGSRSGTGDRQSSHLIDTSIGKVDVRNCNIVGEKNSQTATRAASPSSPYFDLSGEDQATFHGEIYPRRYGSTHVSDLVRHHVIRLQQLLPGVNVTRAVRTEPRLLNAPIPHLIRQLIKLRDGLPDANILSMINSLPRILLDDEISSRIEITVDKLRVLCPTKDMCSADVDGLVSHGTSLTRLYYWK